MTARADTLAALEADLAAGRADAIAGPLLKLLAADPADPRPYHLGFRALGSATDPTGADWTALIRLLVNQQAPERPHILQHGLASLLTSQNAETARRMVAAILPALAIDPATAPQGTALLLMVTRSLLPEGAPAQADITALHLRHFPDLAAGDLALPYSVMFNAAAFGANRDDLLARYPDATQILADTRLGLRHILLLDRLGAGPVFTAPDNGDLLACLRARLRVHLRTAPDPDEQAAARVLILRYWRPSGRLDAPARAGLGLDPALLTHAAGLARPDPRAALPAPDLQARPRKTLRTATNLLRLSLPFLNRPGRKPRVALCVSGQMRGYRAALATWRRALLPFADFDIHIHTWSRIGRATPHPFRAALPFDSPRFCAEWRRIGTLESFETLQHRYPALFAALDSTARIDADTLQALYGTRSVVVEDEDDPRFAGFTNQDRMHYKIAAAHDLATDPAHPGDHDLVLRLRPDLPLTLPGFSWPDLHRACRADPVIFAEDGYGLHYHGLMMGDQLAVGAPDVMAIHAATARTWAPLAALNLAGFPPTLTGHVSLAGTCWLAGIDVRKLPFRRGPLLDADALPPCTIRAALETDAQARHDAHDRALLAAVAEDPAS